MGGILAGGVPLPIDDVVVDGLDEPELVARDLLDPAGVEKTGLVHLEGFDRFLELTDLPVASADVEAEFDRFRLVPDVECQDADDQNDHGCAERDPLEAQFAADHQTFSAARSLADRAREFAATSASEAMTGFFVRTLRIGAPSSGRARA